jgi:hypothetical protein
MLGEPYEDVSEDKVHDFPISCEGVLAGGDEDLVNECVGEFHEGHLSESLDEELP